MAQSNGAIQLMNQVMQLSIEESPRSTWRQRIGTLWSRWRRNRLTLVGGSILLLLLFIGIFGPTIAPYSPTEVSLMNRLKPPTLNGANGEAHILGTDQLGRDIFSRILHAAQVTIVISTAAVALAGALGVFLGLISGFFGGTLDHVLMRIVDIQLAFPTMLLAICIVAIFGTSIPILIGVFVLAGWVRYVRVIRAKVLVLKEMQFVQAAHSIGGRRFQILRRHILPNVLTEIIILLNLEIGRIILLESSLSYLGLGIQPPLPTWGNMLNEGRLYLVSAWWIVTFPGLIIVIAVLGVNLFGEGLRSLYDPTARE